MNIRVMSENVSFHVSKIVLVLIHYLDEVFYLPSSFWPLFHSFGWIRRTDSNHVQLKLMKLGWRVFSKHYRQYGSPNAKASPGESCLAHYWTLGAGSGLRPAFRRVWKIQRDRDSQARHGAESSFSHQLVLRCLAWGLLKTCLKAVASGNISCHLTIVHKLLL